MAVCSENHRKPINIFYGQIVLLFVIKHVVLIATIEPLTGKLISNKLPTFLLLLIVKIP